MPAVNTTGGHEVASTTEADRRYEAEIVRTTHGVAHVTADDLGSVCFGQGYACAADHLPAIADHVTKVNSERSRHLGVGAGHAHLHSDLGYLALGVRQRGERMATTQPPEVREAVRGYAAGVNRWLAEHGTGELPAWCRDASWIRPVSDVDLFTVYADLAIMASGRNLVSYIGSATPPGTAHDEPPPPIEPIGEAGLASNAWALGGDVTATGRGMVMANPHFPWYGEGRFWECHLRVPDLLDVYGVSLIGSPLVQIGFNRRVAWSHTFSRGHRFTVYSLTLADRRPTTYRYGDDERELVPTRFEVEVLGDDGAVAPVARTLWSSHYGPMLDLPFLGWSDQIGFTYRDANLDNDRFLGQVLAMDRATSVGDLRAAAATHDGMPWVNTLAADDEGRIWYADTSTTPNLSDEAQARFLAALDEDLPTQLLMTQRVALLDGSDPAFEWVDDPAASAPGLIPPTAMPHVERRDVLFNANDPYWLPHPSEQLPQRSPMHGLHHAPVSARTRMNAWLLRGDGPAGPTANGRWTAADVEAAALGNHSLLAELLLDDVLARLADVTTVTVDGRDVEVRRAVEVLARWDRRFDVSSVGAVVWRELLGSFPDDALTGAGALWAEPYDPYRAVDTPAALTPAPADGPDPLALALARAVVVLEGAGVAVDAPLGEVQWVQRGDERIAIHGGGEVDGITNVVTPVGALTRSDLEPGPALPATVAGRTERTGLHTGGYPVTYGASFVMVVAFGDDGPDARGLLVYGQSGHPASPHHADQARAFVDKDLRPLRWRDADIAADPDRTEVRVQG
jgi:acyl-homoserine-lactone acylase